MKAKDHHKVNQVLHELLNLASRLDINMRREKLGDDDQPVESGLARVDDQDVIFLDSGLSTHEMCEVMIRELVKFPLDDIYLKPGIRALLITRKEDATPE